MRILFVEDDADLGYGVTLALQKLGYLVDHVDSGVAADHMLVTQFYDLVVLDIGLPRMDGLEVLRRLRRRKSEVPVLVLTARDSIADRVTGLDAGADDYLIKPFAMDELVARARALMRRGTGATAILTNGVLTVDTAARQASVGTTQLKLSPREFILLELFVQNLGKALLKAELIQRFSDWENELGGNAIEVSIFRLRRKLEPFGVEIKTVRNTGYLMEPANDHTFD